MESTDVNTFLLVQTWQSKVFDHKIMQTQNVLLANSAAPHWMVVRFCSIPIWTN